MADPTREQVVAWMAENGAGYKAGAAHFDIPVSRAKGWRRWATGKGLLPKGQAATSTKPTTPATPPPPVHSGPARTVGTETRLDYLRAELGEVHQVLGLVEATEAQCTRCFSVVTFRPSASGVAALRREARQLRGELDAELDRLGRQAGDNRTAEEKFTALVELGKRLPRHLREEAARAWLAVESDGKLRVIEGG